MSTLIGTAPDQVPVNGMLGDMAFQNKASVKVADLTATGTTTAANLAYTGTLTGSTGILNIGSGQVYKDASGNVGIGTSTTTADKLTISAGSGRGLTVDANGPTITLSNGGTALCKISSGSTGAPGLSFTSSREITFNTGSLTSPTGFAQLGPNGGINIGYSAVNMYSIPTNGAIIAGNVGIGTSSPTSGVKLDVNGTIKIATGTSSSAGCIFTNANYGMLFQAYQASPALADFSWLNSAGTERMRIDSSGNVGIGTIPTSVPATGNPVIGANNLIMYNAGNLGLTLLTDNAATRTQQIGFGSQGLSLFDAGLKYDNSSRSLQLWTGASVKMTIDASGNVLVGGATAAAGNVTLGRGGAGGGAIQVFNKPNSGATNAILNYYGATYVGGMNMDNTSTSFITSSDKRLKENIIDAPSAIGSINSIQIRSFNWIGNASHQMYGVIAQEIQSVAPECVCEGQTSEDTWGVDYSKLTPRLVKAIQEQQTLIEALTARLTKAGL
jgi:hypothetical protein